MINTAPNQNVNTNATSVGVLRIKINTYNKKRGIRWLQTHGVTALYLYDYCY